jgi:dihydropteroate synthase
MLDLVAKTGATYVLMHWRAPSNKMDSFAHYEDVTGEVMNELTEQLRVAQSRGVNKEQVIVDPGFGFAKDINHNWGLMANLSTLTQLGYPVLIGASRKRFVASLVTPEAARPPDMARLDEVGSAIAVYAVAAGVWGVRTHDPAGVAKVFSGALVQ